MLIQKFRNVLRAIFIASILFTFLHNTLAQDQSQPADKPVTKKAKAKAETCDGALDIVPAKSVTFTRKRRQPKNEQSGASNTTEAKATKPAEPRP